MTVQYYKRFRMELDLSRALLSASLPFGYSFLPYDVELLDYHADVKFRSFRWELDSNVFPCLGDAIGCRQLMGDISRREGFLPEATWLIGAAPLGQRPHRDEAEFCGTIQGVMTDGFTGSIQNVGVTPNHRGRGLGAALVLQAAAGFRSAGLDRVQLEVTARNVDAIRLYRRLGFRTVKTVYKAVEIAYT
jgi:ribosomal protein S18 acetylase RimI-like enzyme